MESRICFCGVSVILFGVLLGQTAVITTSADESVSEHDIKQLLYHMKLNQGFTLVIFTDRDVDMDVQRAIDDWLLEHGCRLMCFQLSAMENVLPELMKVVIETRRLETYHSSLNFIVFTNGSVSENIQKITLVDDEYGKGSLLRHFSKWLFIDTSGQQDVLAPSTTVLDNVAVLYRPNTSLEHTYTQRSGYNEKDDNCIFRIATLMWQRDGRQWSYVGEKGESSSKFHICKLFPNVNRGLNGRRIKAGVMKWAAYCKKVQDANSTFTFVSTCRDVMEYMASALNFTYDFVEPNDKQWGDELANKSWDGLLGMITRNEVDLSPVPYGVTIPRSTAMSFSSGLWTPTYQACYLRQFSDRVDWKSLVACFKWEVYLCAIAVVICVLILFVVAEQISGMVFSIHDLVPRYLLDSSIDIATTVIAVPFHQGTIYQPSTTPGKLLHVSWWFFCIIITAVYTGNLIAFLTVEKERIPFTTLKELAADQEFELHVPRTSYLESVMSSSNVSTMKALWRKVVKSRKGNLSSLEENDHHMALLRTGRVVVIEITDTLDFFDSAVPNLRRMKQAVSSIAMCLPFPKYSPLEPLFSREVLTLFDTGMLKGMMRTWDTGKNTTKHTERHKLEISDLKSMLVACAVGVLLSGVCLLVEHLCSIVRCKHQCTRTFKSFCFRDVPEC